MNDLERDIHGEDEVRRLLSKGESGLETPPFRSLRRSGPPRVRGGIPGSAVVAAAVVLLIVALIPLARRGAPAVPGSSGAPTASAERSPASTLPAGAASPAPSMRTVAFPDLPFVVGTGTGDLYFQLRNGQPAGAKVHVCAGSIWDVVTYKRQVLALCGLGDSLDLYLWDEAHATPSLVAKSVLRYVAFTGTGSVVYVTMGQRHPGAPTAMTRLMLQDLASGKVTRVDQAYGVAFGLRLTGEGVAVWRPKNSLSFVRPEAEAGTWILHGTALTRFSALRLIDGRPGLDALETEGTDQPGNLCCTAVYEKTTSERRLTPNDIPNEHVAALLGDGRIVTWRGGSDGRPGDMAVYAKGTVQRLDHGVFSAFGIMHSGDWVVARKSAPGPELLAYRIADGAFASTATSGWTAIALLDPKP